MELIRLECNYSSWSLRAYLMLCQTGQEFSELAVPTLDCDHYVHLRELSPSGKVPVLRVDGMVLWESLAIGEFLHERFPACGLYPAHSRQRALARCLACEMHAGFSALREHCPMDIRSRHPVELTDAVREDVRRIEQLWTDCLQAGGEFLFGGWTLVDAMYAPVVTRFRTYDVHVNEVCRAYCQRVLEHPWMRAWCEAAEHEETLVVPGLNGPTHVRRR